MIGSRRENKCTQYFSFIISRDQQPNLSGRTVHSRTNSRGNGTFWQGLATTFRAPLANSQLHTRVPCRDPHNRPKSLCKRLRARRCPLAKRLIRDDFYAPTVRAYVHFACGGTSQQIIHFLARSPASEIENLVELLTFYLVTSPKKTEEIINCS